MTQQASENYKIIISGPSTSGKTTAIHSLSDTTSQFIEKNQDTSSDTMDYGMLEMPGGEVVHLYGTSDDEQSDGMREILTEDGLGLLLLINNNSQTPFEDLDHYLDEFSEFISNTSLAIGITNMDTLDEPNIEQYNEHLAKKNMRYPIFDVDAREKRDVKILLQALLYSLH